DGPPTFLMTKSRYRGLLRTQPTHLRGEAGRPASTYAAATHPNTHGGGCPGRSSGYPLIAPHAPGEDISAVDGTVTVTGSPPRVLGAPADRWSAESTAHPHVRGEDVTMSWLSSCEGGSPPRAWGGLDCDACAPVRGRLTPTCLGRTGPRGPRPSPETAHLHVRGEDAESQRESSAL